MLVKIGDVVSVDVQKIISVNIEPHKEIKKKAGWFQKEESKDSLAVKVTYINHNGHETSYTVYGFDHARAQKTYKEVLDQVKEIENVGATQALEEALKNG